MQYGPKKTTCEVCGRDLWFRAETCPGCAYERTIHLDDHQKALGQQLGLLAVVFLGVLVALSVFYDALAGRTGKSRPQAPARHGDGPRQQRPIAPRTPPTALAASRPVPAAAPTVGLPPGAYLADQHRGAPHLLMCLKRPTPGQRVPLVGLDFTLNDRTRVSCYPRPFDRREPQAGDHCFRVYLTCLEQHAAQQGVDLYRSQGPGLYRRVDVQVFDYGISTRAPIEAFSARSVPVPAF